MVEENKEDKVAERIRNINKRKMAYISLTSNIIITLLMMFIVPKDRIDLLSNTVEWFYIISGGVILTYMGVSALPTIFNKGPVK